MTFFTAVSRPIPEAIADHLCHQGVHPLMAALYAARGISDKDELGGSLGHLLSPDLLTNSDLAGKTLAQAILSGQKILVIGDYDCDGATATAVAVSCLRELGACVDYLIPNRLIHGYGLSAEIARLAIEKNPDWVITVDSGISDVAGVAQLKSAQIGVIITDHHIASSTLPAADIIVNPNLPDCQFPSKSLSGVGVVFYVMMQLRSSLRTLGHFQHRPEPNLASYLDLVALGTIADVVCLDKNNRILVTEGLLRIRARKARAGLLALLSVSGRRPELTTAEDFAFFIAPRLNAAGRLGDMTLSVECLLAETPEEAERLADRLHKLNKQRQSIQETMLQTAEKQLGKTHPDQQSLTLYHETWHEGIIGIIAGRLKDRCQKPVFVFAPASDGFLKGSGRSVADIHLHAALVEINRQYPDLLHRFGGHAAAAGVAIAQSRLDDFQAALETVTLAFLSGKTQKPTLETDGSLALSFCNLETALLIENQIWGQGFPSPVFVDHFSIEKKELLANKHLKLTLKREGAFFEAILFNKKNVPDSVKKVAYRLIVDRYQNRENIKLHIEGWVV